MGVYRIRNISVEEIYHKNRSRDLLDHIKERERNASSDIGNYDTGNKNERTK